MRFNSALFVCFFLIFFVAFHFAARTRRAKLWLITTGSLLFYAAWDYRFVPLLLGTALVDFFAARAIEREARPRARRLYLAISVVANLGVLATFKYLDFFLGSLRGLFATFGATATIPHLELILPAGISFYTFQSMSYTIDVFRRELRAREHPLEFLAAVSFFPHLVAGPIIRASTLLPQFESMAMVPAAEIERGLMCVALGLAKKTIADLLAGTASQVFAGGAPDLVGSWTGALAFAGQIYADFSGYTDIAIGVALLLGFVLPPNFNLPYLADSPVEFWRRWHISLSSWLRDYLYIPLGGGRRHRQRNLIVTMLLGGLWHGASWTFVAWGLYHGVLLSLTHVLFRAFPRLAAPAAGLGRAARVCVTFYLVVVGWVLFRAETFGRALGVLGDMHRLSGFAVPSRGALFLLALTVAGLVVPHLLSALAAGPAARRPVRSWSFAVAMLAFGIALGASGPSFIYFQF